MANVEQQRICDMLLAAAFMEGEKKHLELHCSLYQALLTRLANKVFCYLQPSGKESIYQLSKKNEVLQFYKSIAMVPEKILRFLEKNFSRYFDENMPMTYWKRSNMIPEIIQSMNYIQLELRRVKVEADLIFIVISPFENFLIAEKNICYRDLAYLKMYRQGIHNFLAVKDSTNYVDDICHLLVYLNYNSLRFLNFLTMQHKEVADTNISRRKLIDYYNLQLKLISQQVTKPGAGYKPGLPIVKEQIISWMKDEIIYLEKQELLLNTAPGEIQKTKLEFEKIHTSLSVAELALAIKVLLDSKVIIHDNSSALLRMVANNFKTDHMHHISVNSIRNKSYNIENGTVNKINDMLKGFMTLMKGY